MSRIVRRSGAAVRVTVTATAAPLGVRDARARPPYPWPVMTQRAHVRGPHLRVPDERPRLRAALRAAGGRGLRRARPTGEQADVVVFNTCAVRENADNKLYGNLGHLAPVKAQQPGHADRRRRLPGAEGPRRRSPRRRRGSTSSSAPTTSARCRCCWSGRGSQEEAQVEILESLEVFPSTLPTRRESAYAAWVSISVGCNNTCTFCIVPALRGKEKDRRPGDVLAEIEALVAEGVIEVTLLGQNVNAYGVEFGDRQAFGKLLRACGEIDGLERVRFTSPHPADFTDDVIEAMAETPNVMPQLHMPLQSGSDRVLKAMRRSYRQAKYLGIIDRVRAAMPDAAITTDIIVGFPGETEEDFQATLDVVRAARFSGAFTFQYSKRPGTPAADLDDQVPPDGRAGALRAAGRAGQRDRLGGEQAARRPHASSCWSPRARAARTPPPTGSPAAPATTGSCTSRRPPAPSRPRPATWSTVEVTYAAPHHLVADGPVLAYAVPAPATPGRRGTAAAGRRPASCSACRRVGVAAPLPDAPACRWTALFPGGRETPLGAVVRTHAGALHATATVVQPADPQAAPTARGRPRAGHIDAAAMDHAHPDPPDRAGRRDRPAPAARARREQQRPRPAGAPSGAGAGASRRLLRPHRPAHLAPAGLGGGPRLGRSGPRPASRRSARPKGRGAGQSGRRADRDRGRPAAKVVAPAGVRVHRMAGFEGRVLWNLGPPRVRYEDAPSTWRWEGATDSAHSPCSRPRASHDVRPHDVCSRGWRRANGLASPGLAEQRAPRRGGGLLLRAGARLPPPGRARAPAPAGAAPGPGAGSVGMVYRDVDYEQLVVELDGRLFHDSTEQRDRLSADGRCGRHVRRA